MIALALLFVFIIGLLGLVIWLLQKYFDAYSSLQNTEKIQNEIVQQHSAVAKKNTETFNAQQEINTVIHQRLIEMERQFPHNETPKKLSDREPELLALNLKAAIRSTLNLLK